MAWLVESPAGDSGASKLRAPRAVIMAPVSLSSARRYTHQYRSVIGCWLITCVGLDGLIGFVFVPHSVRCHSAWLADRLSGSGILIDSHRFFFPFLSGRQPLDRNIIAWPAHHISPHIIHQLLMACQYKPARSIPTQPAE